MDDEAMTTNNTDGAALLPVTQSDRDAAADAQLARGLSRGEARRLREGDADEHWLVQAFARHRQSHSLPGDVGMREALEGLSLAADEINGDIDLQVNGDHSEEVDVNGEYYVTLSAAKVDALNKAICVAQRLLKKVPARPANPTVEKILTLAKRKYHFQPTIGAVLRSHMPTGTTGHDWDDKEAFSQAIAILDLIPDLAALSSPLPATQEDAERSVVGNVPRPLYEALGNLVSECADQRDVYPDAATALEAITSTVNEIYACIEDGVFGALSTPQRQEYDGEAVREALTGLEWTDDGYSLRTPYDGDVDGDGRHIIVGGEVVVTFADSEVGDEYRERILAALAHPAQARDEMRESVLFNLTWIAPPSPELPDGRRVHPEPMTGRQSFPSWEKALRFMSKRCEGTEFVSLTQTTSRTVDRSDEFRAALSSDKGEEM